MGELLDILRTNSSYVRNGLEQPHSDEDATPEDLVERLELELAEADTLYGAQVTALRYTRKALAEAESQVDRLMEEIYRVYGENAHLRTAIDRTKDRLRKRLESILDGVDSETADEDAWAFLTGD